MGFSRATPARAQPRGFLRCVYATGGVAIQLLVIVIVATTAQRIRDPFHDTSFST